MVAQTDKGRDSDPDPDSYLKDALLTVVDGHYLSRCTYSQSSAQATARVLLMALMAWLATALTACASPNPYVTREYLHVDRRGREVFSSRPLAPDARYTAVVTGVVTFSNYAEPDSGSYERLEGDAVYLNNRLGNFDRPHRNLFFSIPAALVQRDRGSHRYGFNLDGDGQKLWIRFDCHPDYYSYIDSDTLRVELYRSDIELSLWDKFLPDLWEFPLTAFQVLCAIALVVTLIIWFFKSIVEGVGAAQRAQEAREQRAREDRQRQLRDALKHAEEHLQRTIQKKRDEADRLRREAEQRQRDEDERRRQAEAAREAQRQQAERERREAEEREKQARAAQAKKAAEEQRRRREAEEQDKARRQQAEHERRRIEEGRRQSIETLKLLYGEHKRVHLEDRKWLEREAKRRRAAILADKAKIEAKHVAFHKDPEFVRQLKAIDGGGIYRRATHEMTLLQIAERLFGTEPPAAGATANGQRAASHTQEKVKAALAEMDDEIRAQDSLTKLLDKRGITDRQDRMRFMHEFGKRIAPNQEEG